MPNVRVPIRRVHTGDRLNDEQQRLAQQVTKQVNGAALPPDARIVPGISIPAGISATVVKHGLGRAYTGWAILRTRIGPSWGVFEVPQNTTALTAIQLTLANAAGAPACTIDLLVF